MTRITEGDSIRALFSRLPTSLPPIAPTGPQTSGMRNRCGIGCHLRETKLRSWPLYNVYLQAEAALHQARWGEATQPNSATTRFSNASDVTGVKQGLTFKFWV